MRKQHGCCGYVQCTIQHPNHTNSLYLLVDGPVISLRRVAGRLSEADAESLVSDFQAGMTLTELGESYGFHRTTVAAFLKKRGIFAGRQLVLSDGQIDEAVMLYEQGLTVNAAAERVGSNYGTAYRALRRRGVVLRPGPRNGPEPMISD